MKILFDQGTPSPLRNFFQNHSVVTVFEKGWNQLKNGDLIRMAEDEGFDVFVTTDSNLKHQQNLRNRSIAIVALLSTSWPKIQKKTALVVATVETATKGSYFEVTF
ncbi:hypothetical protein HY522_02445 [bacterium]|nr:hypothetical protein [bacterium]